MNTENRMPSHLDQIRDPQRDTWDRFSAGWKKWDGMVLSWLAPFGEAMIRQARLREDSNVLDIAVGTGEPGLTAAALVPRGHVTLTDLAEHMLAVATEERTRRGLGNVETRVCDASALPFADASFDTVLCRFGFMFFPDVSAAIARVRTGGKAGGTDLRRGLGGAAEEPLGNDHHGYDCSARDDARSAAGFAGAVSLCDRRLHARDVR
jgi:SAM-dependent methyltransferase